MINFEALILFCRTMINIHTLVLNPFQVNTYILSDDNRKAVIIDPACYGEYEETQLLRLIQEQDLIPEKVLLTHCHIDHILGYHFLLRTFGLEPLCHEAGLPFLEHAPYFAGVYGFKVEQPVLPTRYLQDQEEIRTGNIRLKALYTPGHADGSMCFYSEEQQFVITGDLIFFESVGRTDLPTGDFALLEKSVQEKILCLDDKVVIYPGHGHETTVGHERHHNPFLNGY